MEILYLKRGKRNKMTESEKREDRQRDRMGEQWKKQRERPREIDRTR